MGSETPQTILVIHLAGIGDLLMGVPALASLRAGFPDSTILLLTWRKSQDVARLLTAVDEWYGLEEGSSWHAVRHNLSTLWRLRHRRVDLAINLYQLYRWVGVTKLTALLHLVRPARTAGRDTDRKGTIFDVKVPESSSEILHEVARQQRVVEQLGCPPVDSAISLRVDEADQQMVEAWLTAHGVTPNDVLIGLHPGALRRCHRWPAESFASVAKALTDADAVRVVLIGSRDERRLAERIAQQLDHPLVAAGELSLGQLVCLMRRLRLLIANDSGPMHLAAALDVPLVALMGPTDPYRYGPYPLDRVNQQLLYTEGCAPCYRTSCRGHDPFIQLSPRLVLEAAKTILQGPRPGGLVRVPRAVRVLHVHTLPVISGSGLNTVLSMQGLPKDRYEVELGCASGGPLLELVERQGMVVRRLHHMVWPIHPLQDVLVMWELVRLMQRQRYTIVHTHNSKAGFVGRLAARLVRVPVVIHTVHGFPFHPYERWWKRGLYRCLERLAAAWSDQLILISQPLIDWALQEHIAPKEKMVKIYSGIDVSAFRQPVDGNQVRASWGLHDHEFVVGEVAKLWPGKGHDILLRAAARLKNQIPSLRLLIVGEGDLRPSLVQLAQTLGIQDRVVFTGFQSDVPALVHAFDVAVLPTLFEGMGRAVIEAQAAGKAVIASRVGGIPDLITDGQTGLLVEPEDVEQLAEAMVRLYEQPALRDRLGQAARRAVDGRFAVQTMVEQIVTLYDRLVERKLGLARSRQQVRS